MYCTAARHSQWAFSHPLQAAVVLAPSPRQCSCTPTHFAWFTLAPLPLTQTLGSATWLSSAGQLRAQPSDGCERKESQKQSCDRAWQVWLHQHLMWGWLPRRKSESGAPKQTSNCSSPLPTDAVWVWRALYWLQYLKRWVVGSYFIVIVYESRLILTFILCFILIKIADLKWKVHYASPPPRFLKKTPKTHSSAKQLNKQIKFSLCLEITWGRGYFQSATFYCDNWKSSSCVGFSMVHTTIGV